MSAVALLSAGLDSTYNLYRAHEEDGVSLALTFDYGQKAAAPEIGKAAAMCRSLGVPHKVISLPWFRDFTATSLVSDKPVPKGEEVSIDDMEVSARTKQAVWVPNRNGILLNIAAAYAEGEGAEFIVPGFNAEEAATFPDNSQAYLETVNIGFKFSTASHVRVKCYSTGMTKTQIVRDAVFREFPLDGIWPCYQSGEVWCGECESCQRFKRAARAGGAPPEILARFK